MPWFVSDRTLWTTVIVGAVIAYYYVPSHLAYVAQITVVPGFPDSCPNKQLRTDAEQAIPHDTLRVLSDGYSHDIRAATIKIVANRTLSSQTKQLILRDLANKDETKRWNAICALRLLFYDQTLSERSYVSHFGDYRSLKAVIAALQNLLDCHGPVAGSDVNNTVIPPSPVQPQYRPAHEELLLPILRDILTLSSLQPGTTSSDILDLALRAGLVSKWLTHYPFPCALPESSRFGFQKSDVCRLMNGTLGGSDEPPWASDDPIMAFIIQHILDFAQGVEALRDAGLLSADLAGESGVRSSRNGMQYTIDDVRMVNGESTAGALTPPEMRELLESARDDGWRSRFNNTTTDMENMRRRNREAIVVAEAGHPLRRENILQRQDSDSAADTTVHRGTRVPLRGNVATRPQAETHEQVIDLSEPIEVPDRPWDLRRQEIEGEAIVNESIREAATNSRTLRLPSLSQSSTNDTSNGTGQEG